MSVKYAYDDVIYKTEYVARELFPLAFFSIIVITKQNQLASERENKVVKWISNAKYIF